MRALLLILDGCGIGELPDAGRYGDAGSATLPHVAEAVGGARLPYLQAVGLGNVAATRVGPPAGAPSAPHVPKPEGAAGKDAPSDHWALPGLRRRAPSPTFPSG